MYESEEHPDAISVRNFSVVHSEKWGLPIFRLKNGASIIQKMTTQLLRLELFKFSKVLIIILALDGVVLEGIIA